MRMSNNSPAIGAASAREVSPWITDISVPAGAFMVVFDSTVVNVSLPFIAGNLSATVEEATWLKPHIICWERRRPHRQNCSTIETSTQKIVFRIPIQFKCACFGNCTIQQARGRRSVHAASHLKTKNMRH
jgi:hypothetical protein